MRGYDYGGRVATSDENMVAKEHFISPQHRGGILPRFQLSQLSQRCRCCRTLRSSFLCLLHLLQGSFLLVSERGTTIFLYPRRNDQLSIDSTSLSWHAQ